MFRNLTTVCGVAAVLAIAAGSARAGDPGQYMGYYAYPPAASAGTLNGQPVGGSGYAASPVQNGQGYPQTNASLYPCPRPDIPQEVGGSIITNAALYPHEMLYAHEYKAVYPPFYHETKYVYKLRFVKDPCCSFPKLKSVPVACSAKLRGTTVKVKYSSEVHPWFLFFPPQGNLCN